jgi:HEAT repeat protein
MSRAVNPEVTPSIAADVQQAIHKLKLLHADDLVVDEAIACGSRAIPALRELLFEREPSGLYQVRRRAVEALAALGAYDVLMDFLRVPCEADDPVERLGDEAVINAAALALTKLHEEHVFQLLLSVARRRHLIGVIAALGTYQRPEAIPRLIGALEADDCRLVTEAALKKLGRPAQQALLEAATLRMPSAERESVSSIRRRRSALGLLDELTVSPEKWTLLRGLMTDHDKKIVLLACKLCLTSGPIRDREVAVHRLIELLSGADWTLAQDIEDCLVVHFDQASDIVVAAIPETDAPPEGDPERTRATRSLLRIRERGEASSHQEGIHR